MDVGIVLAAVVPIVVVIGLGYAGGKAHAFSGDAVKSLSTLMLDFALPAALFTSTASVRREVLLEQLPTLLVLAVVIAATWGGVYALGRGVFRNGADGAAVQAILVSQPAVPFFGFVILPAVLGSGSDAVVSLGALVLNLIPVPATVLALALGGPRAPGDSTRRVVVAALLSTVRSPLVVAPVLGVVLVLVGVRLPDLLGTTLQTIGNASSGIGLFVSGLVLASVAIAVSRQTVFNVLMKDLAVPAVAIGVALLLRLPDVDVRQAALLAGVPSGPLSVLLAARHHAYQREAATSMAVSVLGFAISLPLVLLLLGAA